MATERNILTRENLFLAAKMTHNNEIIDVAEVLNETNDPIQDAHVQQGNDITSHVVSRRTYLPAPSWVKVGDGWDSTVAGLTQARETIGQLKARYSCPQDVMRLQPNPAKYRQQQERTYVEALGQEVANTLISGTTAGAPEEFDGLATRYTSLSTNTATYVVSNGNTSGSDNTSIWFVQWGAGKVYLIYPRNSGTAGIKKEDKGLQRVTGTNSKYLYAYETEFSWDVGLCVEDTRCVKRLCNIDSVHTETYTLDEDKVIQIRNNFKTPGTVYMYCNETVFTQIQILAKDKSNVQWSENNPFGKPVMYFLDMPVRRCDGITNSESIIS